MLEEKTVWQFFVDDDELPKGAEIVEFKLIYRGRLPAASKSSTRNKEKHQIRKVIHKQLRELWKIQPPMTVWRNQIVEAQNSPTGTRTTVLDVMAHKYGRWGYRFVPLIVEERSLGCELDIVFLRRDAHGKILSSAGGDLDNRLKVLFDALRMPRYQDELAGFDVEPHENPFFVLLEDDSLISKIVIAPDRLLTPLEDDESINDVHLIITARVKVFRPNMHMTPFM